MFNIAIIGTGNIAPSHIDGLLEFKDKCKIVALVDIYPEKAEAMKKKYDLDCKIFASHKEMLDADLKIDIVHVCTPPYTHCPISIDIMDSGINVVVEKPMATSLKECDDMILAEKRNNVMLACIAQNRFRQDIFKLKQILDTKKAGTLKCSHINSFWWRGHNYYDLWWRGTWEKEGGGPTLNHAVHHIDMLNWMKGDMPIEVTSILANVCHDNSEVEDLSFALLKYKDNSVAQITSSVVHHGEEQSLIMQCDNAKIQAPWNCFASKQKQNGFPIRDTKLEEELNDIHKNLENLKYEGHTGEIHNILTALENNERPLITGIDGRNTVELISAIYKSGFSKCTITLPIKNDDEFYTVEGLMKNVIKFYEKGVIIENFDADDITVGNY